MFAGHTLRLSPGKCTTHAEMLFSSAFKNWATIVSYLALAIFPQDMNAAAFSGMPVLQILIRGPSLLCTCLAVASRLQEVQPYRYQYIVSAEDHVY